MICVCTTNERGEVEEACGAHMAWLRHAYDIRKVDEKFIELDQVKKELEYQTKRANTFEKLIVNK